MAAYLLVPAHQGDGEPWENETKDENALKGGRPERIPAGSGAKL